MKTSLFITTALAAFLVAGAASAEKITFVIEEKDGAREATGEEELPEDNNSVNKATFSATLDTEKKTLCAKYELITGNAAKPFEATLAHIHKAGEDGTGPAVIDLETAKFTGKKDAHLVDADDADLEALAGEGDFYFNVHSADFPNGEVRGNLVADPAATEVTCETTTSSSSSSSSSSGTGTGTSSGSSGASSGSTSGSTSGASGTTPASTEDDGGCNTTGSSSGDALAFMAGLGLVVAAASRRKKKA
jgi:hypothetical protein